MNERCRMCGFPIVHDGHGLTCTGCAPEKDRVRAIDHIARDNARLRALTHQQIRDVVAATSQESEWPARAVAEVERLRTEGDQLRAALLANQWGSCDGCNNGHHYCPECKAPRFVEDEATNAYGVEGVHFAPCSIAVALGLPLRTK